MNFYVGNNNPKEKEEIEKSLNDFRENYSLSSAEKGYVIKKQESDIAPYFIIFSESGGIKSISPKKAGHSHIENLLMDNEKQAYILVNGKYFMVLKQTPECLKNQSKLL